MNMFKIMIDTQLTLLKTLIDSLINWKIRSTLFHLKSEGN
uniref:Uncharacterized protein n=1 Tax=Arundo donax TaxID=35708 RepID=A0A0A8Y988_ARUDO